MYNDSGATATVATDEGAPGPSVAANDADTKPLPTVSVKGQSPMIDVFSANPITSTEWHAGRESWPNFVRGSRSMAQSDRKGTGGAYVLGRFEGTRRRGADLIDRCALVLDMDQPGETGTKLSVKRAFTRVDTVLAGVKYLAHTTYSHTGRWAKLRIVIPLAGPVSPEVYRVASRIMIRRIGADLMDPTCDEPERAMYCPQQRPDAPRVKFAQGKGRVLDAEALVGAGGTEEPALLGENEAAEPKGKRIAPAALGGLAGLFCEAVSCEEVLAVSGGTWIPAESGERYALAGDGGAPGAYVDPSDPTRFYSHYHGRNYNAHELLVLFADGAEVPPPAPDAPAPGERVHAVQCLAFDAWQTFREAITRGFPCHDPDAFGDGTLTRKRAADEAARSARYARADEVRTEIADAVARVEKALTEAETTGETTGATGADGDALWSALAVVKAERPVEADAFRQRVKRAFRVSLATVDAMVRKVAADASDEVEGDDAVERVIAMVRDRGELFIGAGDSAAYFTGSLDADEAVVTPGRTWAVESGEFRSALRAMYYRATGRALKGQTPNDAAANLAALALDQGATHPVYLRAGFTGEGTARRYVIDLGDDTHRAVVVSAARGVEVVDTAPVRFVRSTLMRPLPTPDAGGTAADLRALVNVTDEAFVPLVAAMIDAYRADTAFPIVEYTGPSGSGKSATTTNHKALIDPGTLMLRAAPKDRDALTAALRSSYVIAYNNMSRLDADLQDALCSVSTVGEGFAGRKLYTDGDEHAVQATRPVIINGISETATASDLVSRLVRIECPPFGADRPRLTDEELAERTRAVMPRAFGFLLATFADALVRLPSVEVSGAGLRMLSYAKLGEAVSRALGRPDGAFVKWYAERTDELSAGALEGSPAAAALVDVATAAATPGWLPGGVDFTGTPGGGSEFVGTLGELLAVLERSVLEGRRGFGWPSTPRALTNVLQRASAALAVVGVEVGKSDTRGRGGRKLYRVTYTPPEGGTVRSRMTTTRSSEPSDAR